jgi:hypothetical protein
MPQSEATKPVAGLVGSGSHADHWRDEPQAARGFVESGVAEVEDAAV